MRRNDKDTVDLTLMTQRLMRTNGYATYQNEPSTIYHFEICRYKSMFNHLRAVGLERKTDHLI